ncbi:MAG: Rpn family recombination-promoting nuclease/putative transposase [Candidatus Eremiobacterota bacterium]
MKKKKVKKQKLKKARKQEEDTEYQFQDKTWRKFFSHPDMLKELLEGYIAEEFIREINFEKIKKLNNTYVNKKFKKRETDLIVKLLTNKGVETYIYLLLEFQSTVDKYMALRLLNYITLFYQDLIDQGQAKDKLLPAVFPVVLYTGENKYAASLNIEELIEKPYEKLEKYIPKFQYYKVALNESVEEIDEEFKKVNNILAGVFKIVTAKGEEEIKETLKVLRVRLEKAPEIKKFINEWLGHLFNYKRFKLENIGEEGVEKMLVTYFKERDKKAKEEGMEEGREEGIKKGIGIGKEEIAKKSLQEGLSVEVVAKITGFSIEEIKALKLEIKS